MSILGTNLRKRFDRMGTKFTIRIEDENGHLTLDNGPALSDLVDFLQAVIEATDLKGREVYLEEIRSGSVELALKVKDEDDLDHLQIEFSRFSTVDESDLSSKERKIRARMTKLLKPTWYIEFLDENRRTMGRIIPFQRDSFRKKGKIYSLEIIAGKLNAIGSTSKGKKDTIIVIDDFDYRYPIIVTEDQIDLLRKDFDRVFRKVRVKFNVRAWVDAEGRLNDIHLVDYKVPALIFTEALDRLSQRESGCFDHISDPVVAVHDLRAYE
jgi:hypothetical protein